MNKRKNALDRMAKVGPVAAAKASRMEEETLLTVGQAAERLQIGKHELRTLLESPSFRMRVVPRVSDNPDEPRRVFVPIALLGDIREALARQQPRPEEQTASTTREDRPEAEPMPLAVVYERLLSEKDARIEDLRAEIDRLHAILEREQMASARTQALLSMQAPAPASVEDIAEPTEAKPTEAEAAQPATPVQPVPEPPKRRSWIWWRR